MTLLCSASPAAPVPRPPHPTSATWIVESPAACTYGTATPASADAAAICPTRLPRSRLDRWLFSFEFMRFLLGQGDGPECDGASSDAKARRRLAPARSYVPAVGAGV